MTIPAMTFRALCPHCDVPSRFSGDWRGRTLQCGNSQCGRAFVAQFVVEEPDAARPNQLKPPMAMPVAVANPALKDQSQWAIPVTEANQARAAIPMAVPVAAPLAKLVKTQPCPRCGKPVEDGTEICDACGTHLGSGRRIVAAKEWDKDDDREAISSGWLGVWSAFVPFTIIPLPYASEAPLRRPPVAALTIVLLCFLCFPLGYTEWGALHLFEWSGDPTIPVPRPEGLPAEIEMPPAGRFAWHQLLTSQFMHGGVEHLIGNMMMLLVVGPKVNDLLGHRKFLLAYLLLGVIAGLPPLFFNMGSHPQAGLGASGSIMGIAGLYLVFSPQPRIRMVWWLRFFVFSPLFCWLFRVRGIWLVLILYALDLIAIFSGSSDRVAHDVHFTGFTVGALSAAMLVALRWVKCGGLDLLTWLFGQEDVNADRDLGGDEADEWSNVSNAPVILFPFVAIVLFSIAAYIYRFVDLMSKI